MQTVTRSLSQPTLSHQPIAQRRTHCTALHCRHSHRRVSIGKWLAPHTTDTAAGHERRIPISEQQQQQRILRRHSHAPVICIAASVQ